jgi:hypothetical protein
MTGVFSNSVQAIELCRVSPNGFIRAVNSQEVTLSSKGYHSIRVLVEEKQGAFLKVARDLLVLPKPSLLYIFEIGFIESLPWDLGKWHWQGSCPLGDSPYFGYSAKWGYKNMMRPLEVLTI